MEVVAKKKTARAAAKPSEPAEAAQPAQQAGRFAKLRRRVPLFLVKGWRLSLVGLGGFSIGCMLGAILFAPSPPVAETASDTAKASTDKVFLTIASRRSEPLLMLEPIPGLNPAVVALGERLFHDPALSGNGKLACATCHSLQSAGQDGLAQSIGVDDRRSSFNAPTVLNAAFNLAQFWDGHAATLEEQLDGPIADENKMASNWERVTKVVDSNPVYRREFFKHLGGEPTPERIRTAIATFERSLVTEYSRFDQWLAGDESALSADEFGGYFLFKRFNCIACHQGYGVGGTMFQKLGKLRDYYGSTASQTVAKPADLGRFNVTSREQDRFVFRVPQLRNVELTSPYLHDGSVETLEKAIAIMIEFQCGETVNLEDVRRIACFLKTLTGKLPNRDQATIN